MKKLLILGSDFTTEEVINYCKKIGVYTVITDSKTPKENPAKLLADEYWMIDYSHVDELEERCRKVGINGIFSGASEPALDNLKILTDRLGLPFPGSFESWDYSRNKDSFKNLCMKCGLDTPMLYDFENMSEEEIKEIKYPVIVKPVDSTASRGIAKCNTEEELRKAYKEAYDMSKKHNVLVEQFITGEICTYTFLVINGEYTMVLSTCGRNLPIKNGKNANSFAIIPCPYSNNFLNKYKDGLDRIFQELKIQNGYVWFQAMQYDGRLYCIEMANRIDGVVVWKIAKKYFGYNIVGWLVDMALGCNQSIATARTATEKMFNSLALCTLMYADAGTIASIEGLEEIEEDERFLKLFQRYKVGDTIPEEINMLRSALHYATSCSTVEEGLELIKKLYDTIKIYDTNGKQLLQRFGDND